MGRSDWVSGLATGSLYLVVGLLLAVTGARADDCVQGPWHTRFVFVGINHYLVADQKADRLVDANGRSASPIDELAGPESDVSILKQAIADTYDLPLLSPAAKTLANGPAQCETPGGLSTTLLGVCATRTAILNAFRTSLRCAGSGDTVLFYFAGHGAEIGDRKGFEPDADGMILPVNARVNPNNPDDADIAGWEIDNIVNEGSQLGVNVVTIFDSCHSAAASRALVTATARGAPPMPDDQKRPPAQPSLAAGSGHQIGRAHV